MKKVITIISCCIIIFSIGGCMNREKYMSDWFTSEQEEADKMMEQIIEACRKQDTQKLKELFSENSRKNIKNIDVKINECSIVIRDSRFVNEFHILKATCKFCTRLSTFVMTFPFFPLLL